MDANDKGRGCPYKRKELIKMVLDVLNVDWNKKEIKFSLSKDTYEFDLKSICIEFYYKNDVVDRFYNKEIEIINKIKYINADDYKVYFIGSISNKNDNNKNKFIKEFINRLFKKQIKNYKIFYNKVGYVGEFKTIKVRIFMEDKDIIELLSDTNSMDTFGFKINLKQLCRNDYKDFKQYE